MDPAVKNVLKKYWFLGSISDKIKILTPNLKLNMIEGFSERIRGLAFKSPTVRVSRIPNLKLAGHVFQFPDYCDGCPSWFSNQLPSSLHPGDRDRIISASLAEQFYRSTL